MTYYSLVPVESLSFGTSGWGDAIQSITHISSNIIIDYEKKNISHQVR